MIKLPFTKPKPDMAEIFCKGEETSSPERQSPCKENSTPCEAEQGKKEIQSHPSLGHREQPKEFIAKPRRPARLARARGFTLYPDEYQEILRIVELGKQGANYDEASPSASDAVRAAIKLLSQQSDDFIINALWEHKARR